MSKKKVKESAKTKKEEVKETEDRSVREGFGGLPDRDLKKSLGCGG
ncbi:hypothetical protein [Fulvivirga sp. M361]|nr:hypothetical protein [Fulvivirga sp. M361]